MNSTSRPVHTPPNATTVSSLPAGVARVDRIVLARTDGAPSLQLDVFVPTVAPSAAGYPVVVMLDGDAVSAQLSTRDFSAFAPALVVTVGYGLEGDALKAARAFDYTPGLTQPDPRAPQLQNGGADRFLAFLTRALRDRLMSTYPVDASAWSLYGHSYGGLFALYALCKQTSVFQSYIAASPSIWWREGAIHAELDSLLARGTLASHVLVVVGEKEAWHPHSVGTDGSADSRKDGWATLPLAQALVRRIQPVNIRSTVFQTIPGATHATLFQQSIAPAIAFATADIDAAQQHVSSQSQPTSDQAHFSS